MPKQLPSPRSTPRLHLRAWQASDRAPFAAMGMDPEVMRCFPSLLTRAASDKSIDAWQAQHAERGWSNWAIELRATGEFVGFAGLTVPVRQLPCTPCVEIGWRLARAHWGQGYATEAAREALRIGFEDLGLDEIVSFTAAVNARSWAVMERLGMVRDDDFAHPALEPTHELSRHRLYRLGRQRWSGQRD
ncbi:MAG: GNAT family N-acetyltransferase [Betaproteobacteria bacterium]